MRSRSVGLITEDPALYADLAAVLRERRIPTVSLLPGDRIPDRVAAVLTSEEEASGIAHPCVIPVVPGADRSTLWAAVQHAMLPEGRRWASELVVGFDPGPRPGFAVFTEGRLLAEGVLDSPDAVAAWADELARRFPGRPLRLRVGSGDPPARNRLVRSLEGSGRSVELVDERSTTPRVARRHRDAAAARAIARIPGRSVRDIPPVRPTLGALTRIQHLSRESSGGRFTISRAEARRVLNGEVSLAEAVAEGNARYGPGPVGAVRARGAPANADIGERVRRPWPPTNPR